MLACLTALADPTSDIRLDSGFGLEHISTVAGTTPARPTTRTVRSNSMQLLNEALARAECARRLDEAHNARVRRSLLAQARNRRQLEIAIRKVERASVELAEARIRALQPA